MRKQRIIKQIAMCTAFFYLSFIVTSMPATAKSNGIITIDGYYDDWEGKPMTELTWNSNNGAAKHLVSMIKDENYIYIYLAMHPQYHSSIPIDAINLSINNQTCLLFLRYANNQNTVDWSHVVDLKKTGTYPGLHPFTSYPNYSLGDAVVNIYNGKEQDKFELRISIPKLEQVMNVPQGTVNNGSRIRLYMPNVGSQTVDLLGTSTDAPVGIVLCIVGVFGVKWLGRKKMRYSQ